MSRQGSVWQTVRRCLAILQRLQRGPADKAELMDAVREVEGEDAYGCGPRRVQDKRFRRDLEALYYRLGVEVRFDREVGGYRILDTARGLLDLPDDVLGALAFLEDTFTPQAPHAEEVSLLVETLRSFLSPERLEDLARCRSALKVDLRKLDEGCIATDVWEAVERAYLERRVLRFEYRSPAWESEVPRCCEVEPYAHFFDTVRRHYYLRGYCRWEEVPDQGRQEVAAYRLYRLDRIVAGSVEVTPEKLPPGRPRARKRTLVYELAPQVARLRDVTRHFEEMEVEYRDDGSALVTAQVEDVFLAVRTLLHYGPSCRVLGDETMLREMRQEIAEMARMYGLVESSG